ncbi:uncharacterized protein KGF55_005638 [Candida pseudojiufengensis]|uniref:uncharacterized protein n=1 Tax=Candida pseudojiufengensis TaxID=497109 RepID=UPI0022255E6A|nr:uncharacterized protein KGF55_005638 [Candida pseudojiufengensis]KAI5958984.1 hypothetical protein KGF55_005638 [Candida pseudojiufengensis]
MVNLVQDEVDIPAKSNLHYQKYLLSYPAYGNIARLYDDAKSTDRKVTSIIMEIHVKTYRKWKQNPKMTLPTINEFVSEMLQHPDYLLKTSTGVKSVNMVKKGKSKAKQQRKPKRKSSKSTATTEHSSALDDTETEDDSKFDFASDEDIE